MESLHANEELPILTLPPEACSYLPGRTSQMEYRFGHGVAATEFEHLLARGWRRFGSTIFRPKCPGCQECRSLRIAVDQFCPSKSQRKALRRNADVSILTQPASVTGDHIALFNAYHADMHHRRGWRREAITEDEYYLTFVSGDCDFAHEMLFFSEGKLLGVALVDLMPASSSSVYFFHDPSWRPASPGTYSLLMEIEAARQSGRAHHYLGYWVAGNQSMQYKANFRPHELLAGHVGDGVTPDWNASV